MKKNSVRALGCFGLIWSLVTLSFDGFIGYRVYWQTRAESYPTAPGAITHSKVTSHSDDDGTTYGIEVRYDYKVGDTGYTGDKHRYGAVSTSDEKPARDFVKEHPPGTKVTVFYNPDEPGDAVLQTGIDGTDYFLALFLTPFNIVMLGVWAAGIQVLYRGGKALPAGGAPILRRPYGVHLRLPRFSALAAAAVTALGVSFVSIFVVAFGIGFGGAASAIQIVWGIVIAASAGVYLWQRYRVGAGLNDLVIDLERDVFSLPQTYGRDGSQEYPLSAIRGVEVDEETHRGNNSSYTTYAPKLVFVDGDGNEKRETLVEWRDRERAESLADWLNERLERKAEEA